MAMKESPITENHLKDIADELTVGIKKGLEEYITNEILQGIEEIIREKIREELNGIAIEKIDMLKNLMRMRDEMRVLIKTDLSEEIYDSDP